MTPQILILLLALTDLVAKLFPEILSILQKSGELTEAEAAAYKTKFEAAMQTDYWQPEAPSPPETGG